MSSNSSVKTEDLMTSILLMSNLKMMSATYKSILASRAWQYYIENKTIENEKRYYKICRKLFGYKK